ncbi:MAG: thioredoxin family protein [Candidatus Levybacteria bacterium]|nr:thioredoxin family protein [Candidatus Levybacteria bacterium]
MKKMIIIVSLLTIALAIIIGFYIVSSNKDVSNTNSIQVTSESSTAINSEKYFEYSKESLESSRDKRRVLFFYASWCPTCRPADANFKENQNNFSSDLTLIRVNYNDPDTDTDEKELAKKYNVTYQHTFVQIDLNGNEITKWNGGQTEVLLTNIK